MDVAKSTKNVPKLTCYVKQTTKIPFPGRSEDTLPSNLRLEKQIEKGSCANVLWLYTPTAPFQHHHSPLNLLYKIDLSLVKPHGISRIMKTVREVCPLKPRYNHMYPTQLCRRRFLQRNMDCIQISLLLSLLVQTLSSIIIFWRNETPVKNAVIKRVSDVFL